MTFITGDILLTNLPNDSIQLIITSPPYNVGIDYDTHSDNMEYTQYIGWLTDVFVYLYDKLSDGGRACVNIAPTGIKNYSPIHHDLVTRLRATNYKFKTEILWYKKHRTARTAWGSFMSPSSPYVLPSWEYVYVFQKGDRLLSDKIPDITKEEFLKFVDGFWEIQPEMKKRGHPVPFPEELVYRLIKLYSYPGDTVCDPFSGSGTVERVAARCNRKAISVDISHEYRMIGESLVGKAECPYCKSYNTQRRGTWDSRGETHQRYYCKECKTWFSPNTHKTDIIFQMRDTSPENIKKVLDHHGVK